MRQFSWWVVMLLSAQALGATPKARLLYLREASAESCPDEAQLRGIVAARLGYDPFSTGTGTTISVTLGRAARGESPPPAKRTESERRESPPPAKRTESERRESPPPAKRGEGEGGGLGPNERSPLRAKIELVDAAGEVTGQRELRSKRAGCAELASAVALAVSLAIDPLSFAEPPDEPAPLPHPPASRVEETPVSPTATTPAATPAPPAAAPNAATVSAVAEDRRLRVQLTAGALAALGASPSVAFGFTVAAGLGRRSWSTHLELRADLPSSGAASGGQVYTALYTGSFVPCFHQGLFAGCLVAMLGGQVSRGEGYPVSMQAATLFAAAGVRAGLRIPLGARLTLGLGADLLIAITRTVLTADELELFRTPPVSGAFHLTFAYRVR